METAFGRAAGATVLLAALAGCSGGGGGGGSSPRMGVYEGVVQDEDGDPVAGARVSIDGIEAAAVTGSDGSFSISDPSLATPSSPAVAGAAAAVSGPEISVLAAGFEPHLATLNVMEGERPRWTSSGAASSRS